MLRKFSIHFIECFQKVCHLKGSDIFGNFGEDLTTDLRNCLDFLKMAFKVFLGKITRIFQNHGINHIFLAWTVEGQ
jgi:hypothetical protein